ncbi:hypothetical protein CMI41_01480 [Candidatus Pacearchaeota archaeon]|jgi:hypothetical protein|nr:hypothetical protein [Candidatus Pacearchaeota archaeon]|tara:strand:- start:5019 stop:5756 length:738 start_codon:yes stop_codon:yes gene_type:complete
MAKSGDEFKTQAEIDRDFQIYEASILRLKDMEELLNHFNTLGFWKDEKKIRSKLRDVTLIAEVEKEIESLKKKIIKKHGKKDLYKKNFSPTKRKHRKKKEFIVGDVPSPIDVVEEIPPRKNSRPLLDKLISLPRKSSANNKYEQEVKGAIGEGSGKPLVIDSSFSEEQEKERKKLVIERAKLESDKNKLSKKEGIINSNYAKYHDIPLSVDRYSYDKAQSREVISRLQKLYSKRGKGKLFGKITE